jgi:hypothetical protein
MRYSGPDVRLLQFLCQSNFLAAGDSDSGIPVRIGGSLLAAIGIYPGIGRYAVKMLANLRGCT